MKFYSFVFSLLFIVLLLSPWPAATQVYYKTETITSKEGLSDDRVNCIMKDRDGFIWIGTRNGLNRYDGYSFNIFRPDKTNSISNEMINDIVEDDDGIIWVATMEGLNRYDPARHQWENIFTSAAPANDDLPSFIVWDIEPAGDHKLWVASDVFEFSLYDCIKKKFEYYDWPSFIRSNPQAAGFSYKSIQRFVKKNDHEFWLATTVGLATLDTRSRQFQLLGTGYYDDVLDMQYDKENNKVYISVANGQLFEYDERTKQFGNKATAYEPYPSLYLNQPGKNEIWMANKNGLLKISDDRNRFSILQAIPGLSGSLLPGGVNKVFKDNEGITWLSTNNGINKFNSYFRENAFLPLLQVTEKNWLNRINSVYYDKAEQIYFACAGSLQKLFLIDGKTGRVEQIDRDAMGATFSSCQAVIADHENRIWLLTSNSIYYYDRAKKKFVAVPIPNNNGADANFRDMVQDKEGNYWLGSFSRGIFYYNKKEKRFEVPKEKALTRINQVTSLCMDTIHNRLWIGTFGEGVTSYNPATRQMIEYYQTDSTPAYSSLNLVHDISQAADGSVWLATHSGGVFRFEEGKSWANSFRQFTMKEGLSSNNYLSICSDGDSTVWLLSGQGVSAISNSGRFLFDAKDEVFFPSSIDPSEDLLSRFIFFNKDKNELLAGANGGLLILSHTKSHPPVIYPLKISRVSVEDRNLPDSIRRNASALNITYRHNSIAFEFVALNYIQANALGYEYRLVGFNDDWINNGNNHFVRYQNLPPGEYVFQVRARDGQGNLSSEVADFSFRVKPPFWRTAWFIALSFLLLATLLYVWISSLRRKIKEEKILNYFATSLYGQNTVDDVFWDVAKNCISQLRFEDCVIYQHDEKRNVLVQKAAFGDKNPGLQEILNPIEIPFGKGIVGSVAKSGKPEIVNNTMRDRRYIVDDRRRNSEIAIPIFVDGRIFGVIDSEHRRRGFYTRRHLKLLQKIAGTCSIKISRYLVEEKLRLKIARDLHDEMGSTLTSINIISKVAMQEPGNATGVNSQLNKIREHSSRMMESMSDMVWAIDPSNDNMEKMITRMKEFAGEILEPAGINYFFREEGNMENIPLNPEQRKDIYLIFKEALNNAVKYSQATEVNISLIQENHVVKVLITDNGRGFDRVNGTSGNGLRNMQSRAADIKASLRIDSIKGAGTTIALEIPIP